MQNSMIFRQCSIGGKVYKGDAALEANEEKLGQRSETDTSSGSGSAEKQAVLPSLHAVDVKLPAGVLTHFRDQTLKNDLANAAIADVKSENATHARNLNGFFSVLALCHTVIAAVDPETGAIEYKAQSPDEA